MNVNWTLARRRPLLVARAQIIQAIRQFFIQEGFLEVETPLRIPAPAPEAHIDAIPSDGWFLNTSPELCMKRLLAAGYERLFQICHCWRGNERGRKHLPEFTMLEWYRADADYTRLMTDCENLLTALAAACGLNDDLQVQGREVRLAKPWQRLTVAEAFARFSDSSVDAALASDRFDEIMTDAIEPMLGIGQPTFLYNYPSERGALARLHGADQSVAERFELYIGGIELANGFSELTDAIEQRRRFEQEEQYRRSSGRIPYPEANKFLAELPAMPPAAGIALGVDRLVMVMLDAAEIDAVVAFTPEDL
ncbi:elongation factor P--(R)-beta-lysine ligase [Geobacter sp. OR-1]|uniref:EF-P lysine aminoacylase EpmA n=1 Tax=Geobacter sp. OR-1 TaxID=1266765 RepID=UPI000542319B|nr:EF-P lysine aminoacylase EpmA [Geobacter sp. OR-1]GAM11555.1 elongation factor P--(R)-beta-lysine ligase [Geobacter sp. OR-1]